VLVQALRGKGITAEPEQELWVEPALAAGVEVVLVVLAEIQPVLHLVGRAALVHLTLFLGQVLPTLAVVAGAAQAEMAARLVVLTQGKVAAVLIAAGMASVMGVRE
jgi:hypothetical protein